MTMSSCIKGGNLCTKDFWALEPNIYSFEFFSSEVFFAARRAAFDIAKRRPCNLFFCFWVNLGRSDNENKDGGCSSNVSVVPAARVKLWGNNAALIAMTRGLERLEMTEVGGMRNCCRG